MHETLNEPKGCRAAEQMEQVGERSLSAAVEAAVPLLQLLTYYLYLNTY